MENFELEYRGEKIRVEEIAVGKNTVFRINFPGNKPLLVISRAKDSEGNGFWTSIPEGRLKQAEEIGRLVEEFLKKK